MSSTVVHYDSRMARTDPQFNLRIPQELKDRLEEAAVANKRSVTAELIARLESSFSDDQTVAQIESAFEAIKAYVAKLKAELAEAKRKKR